jgi:hypothetical protein
MENSLEGSIEKLVGLIDLLNEYGTAKFDDDWCPGDAYGVLSNKKAAALADALDDANNFKNGRGKP